MSLRRKVTGALAWAGLAIVIAVPAAETVSSKLVPADNNAAVVGAGTPKTIAVIAPVPATRPAAAIADAATEKAAPAVAEVAPTAVTPVAASAGSDSALQQYLASGKKLPDYITTGSAHPAAASAAAPAQPEPAVLPAPAATATASVAPATATEPPTTAAETDAPAPAQQAAPPLPRPVKARPKPVQPEVTDADLKDWKSGSLEDYLRQHGLLTGADSSQNGGN
jgi:hypothetical protein